jgi:hypothetical protein
MEILMTVLITLGVCTVMYTFACVVRLNRKAGELEDLRMETIDVEVKLERMITDLENDLNRRSDDMQKDYIDRINGWVASTDRRFDKAYNEIQKLDETVNPNMDILKK